MDTRVDIDIGIIIVSWRWSSTIILLTTIILDRATIIQLRCDSIARKTSEVQNMKFKPNRKIKYTDDELQLLLHLRRKGGHVKPSKKTYNRKQKHKSKNF